MKLKVLVDNNTYIDKYYYGEPAVSYYIEDNGTKILLDVGYSDLFIKNAINLGVNLAELNYIVISHGHNDHTGGLKHYFKNYKDNSISLVAHPEALNEKFLNSMKISSDFTIEELNNKCNLLLSKNPKKLSDNIIFLGEIPNSNKFEKREPIGMQLDKGIFKDDYLLDDTALVFKSNQGIYIITGCSHSGICNIIDYAKKVCNDNRVLGIIGGLHLFEINEQVTNTIKYLKKEEFLTEFYPCHCTSFLVKSEINKTLPVKEVGISLEINW